MKLNSPLILPRSDGFGTHLYSEYDCVICTIFYNGRRLAIVIVVTTSIRCQVEKDQNTHISMVGNALAYRETYIYNHLVMDSKSIIAAELVVLYTVCITVFECVVVTIQFMSQMSRLYIKVDVKGTMLECTRSDNLLKSPLV